MPSSPTSASPTSFLFPLPFYFPSLLLTHRSMVSLGDALRYMFNNPHETVEMISCRILLTALTINEIPFYNIPVIF
jgi:hypothetical protein